MSPHDVSEPDKPSAFHSFQSTFTPTRRARPPPVDNLGEEGDDVRVPLKAGKLQRAASKGGLRAMFTRNRLEKDGMTAVLEEPLPDRRPSEAHTIAGHSIHRNDSVKKPAGPMPTTPAKSNSKLPRMNLRSKSVKETDPARKPTPRSTGKTNPKPVMPRSPAAWDPPPLFQAYPQAIKHAQLSSSILSADSVIRMSNHKRNNSLGNGATQPLKNGIGPDQGAAKKAVKVARSRHRRQMSGSISKADWTQKIYVLVTSGYLLQYAGDGPFDRLPEKILQLGKDSVAFASDVIPGKHWVLQISQSIDADGMPTADSRSLLSRLTFRGAEYRRAATSFLLVLDSAEEMDSWIAVVRREIESLGGKKQLSETGKQKPDDRVLQLKPSHRYLAQKNPDHASNPSSPMSPSFGPPPWKVEDATQRRTDDSAISTRRPSLPTTLSVQHSSIPTSIMHHETRQRENLRENGNRLSYMSSGQRTLVTSQHSSAASSPTRESIATNDEISSKISHDDLRLRPNARILSERRRSMQTLQLQTLESLPKNFRHSTYGVPNRSPRNYSFPKPTFPSPASSVKRQPADEPPPVPVLTPTIKSKSMRKGSRKPPPAALDVNRPRSAGSGPLSPKSAPPVFTPTNSSFKMLQQSKPSIVNIPARSNPSTPVDMAYPERRSSLMPDHSEETNCIRRNASMVALQEATRTLVDEPSRPPPPLPPAALVVPLPLSPTNQDNVALELEAAIAAASRRTVTSGSLKQRRPVSMQNPLFELPSPTESLPPVPKSPRSVKSARSSKSVRISPKRAYFPPSAKDLSNYTQPHRGTDSQRLKPVSNPALANRRSMPMLVSGPPPMPPPNCALPPLPPGTSPRNAVVSRESVRIKA